MLYNVLLRYYLNFIIFTVLLQNYIFNLRASEREKRERERERGRVVDCNIFTWSVLY